MAMTMIAKIVLKWDIDFVDAARKNVLADTSEGAWRNALSPARETPRGAHSEADGPIQAKKVVRAEMVVRNPASRVNQHVANV